MDKNKELNVDAILSEATALISSLINDESSKLQAMKKSEESSKKEESKEEKSSKESSKKEESMAKDEMSQEPAPADAAAPEMSQEQPQQGPQEDQGAGLQELVSGLDDGMLQELMQTVQSEMEARQASQPQQEESTDAIPQAPEASQEMNPAASPAMKSESEDLKAKLAKSEQEMIELKKAFESLTDTIVKSVSKPKPKAVAEIRNLEVVTRGEDSLNKSEKKNPTTKEVLAKMSQIASDRNSLQSLNKSEMETMQEFFSTKTINDKVLQLFNK
jgi:hypothetical protein